MLKHYVHTIKYLKIEQIAYRLYYLFRKPHITTIPDLIKRRSWLKAWAAPTYLPLRLSPDGVFSCLAEFGSIMDREVWNQATYTALWLYHLHYFDALNARDADKCMPVLRTYLDQWLAHNPPLQGVAWDPYPLSLRVVNWIIWFSKIHTPMNVLWLQSLWLQADVLMQRIEYHIAANHLFANAKALIFLGAYFSGSQADKWLAKGLQIFDRELDAQFLPDGGHVELSPMYHALLMWDLCDLLNLAQSTHHPELLQRASSIREVIMKGMVWLSHMVHPDGDIAFFNDATLGVAPTLADLNQYVAYLGLPIPVAALQNSKESPKAQILKSTGYIAVYFPDQGKVILDVANVGVDYQPGHAHADTLSFELSLFGQRVLVNSGISQYGLSAMRTFQRGTKAHNTVCVNGADSSEVWSGFRVARRAYPKALSIIETPESTKIHCAHNGYWRAPHRVVHHRTWIFTSKQMIILDHLQGRDKYGEARFYFHPNVRIIKISDYQFEVILLGQQRINITFSGATSVMFESTQWYPAFGQSLDNKCLKVRFESTDLETKVQWM